MYLGISYSVRAKPDKVRLGLAEILCEVHPMRLHMEIVAARDLLQMTLLKQDKQRLLSAPNGTQRPENSKEGYELCSETGSELQW